MAKEKTICAALSVPDQSPMGWWSVGELCWLVVKAGPMFPFGSRLGISKMTVGKWRRRDLEQGIEGLREKERPGDPRTHDDERVAKVSNTALHSKPLQGTDWSVRTMARHRGISKSTVHRWFKMFGVRPHGQGHFKIANNPFFVEKVHDIMGLYMNSPNHAVVPCVDEKTQIQTLERTQPLLPLGSDYVEGVTHDYINYSKIMLFTALDSASVVQDVWYATAWAGSLQNCKQSFLCGESA